MHHQPKNSDFIARVADQLNLSDFAIRRLFSGTLLLVNHQKIGFCVGEDFYWYTEDDSVKTRLSTISSTPFTYERQGKIIQLKNYWHIPAEILENKEELERLLEI